MYSHLHVHGHVGSRLDAIGSSADYAQRAFDFGHKALAITDHGRANAIFEHQQACIKFGVKPIIGIEMYLNDTLEVFEEDKRKRTKNYHIVILVKNNIGYNNFLKLNYLSMTDDKHFYYSPRITQDELFQHGEGLIIGSGCFANPFISLARQEKYDEAEKLFEKYAQRFDENFYVEIQLNEMIGQADSLPNGQKSANDLMINFANKYGIPIVITGDVHYLEKGQNKLQTLAIAIRDKSTIDNIQFEFESKELFFHDIEDYIDFNQRFGYNYSKNDIFSWCNNTEQIVDKIDFTIPKRSKLFLPKMTEDDDKTLISKGKEGLCKKFKVDDYSKVPKEYRDRLEYELEVIIRKGFSSYFLIVEDITQFSIKENIDGRFGRGSVGGSLLAYALELHNLDPIKRNLIFERFINDARCSDLVIDYLK